jgi:ribosome maturation factor RimP
MKVRAKKASLFLFLQKSEPLFVTEDILSKISELTEKSIQGFDCYLIDIEVQGKGANPTLWVYLDSEKGGVSLDTCSQVSKKLSVLFDAHNLFDGRYRLNVSSPGLDRPLKDKRQFIANKGRKSQVKYRYGEEIRTIKGTLDDVGDEILVISSGKEQIRIAFSDVMETKILPAF